MTHEAIIEVINSIVGPTKPTGDSNEDEKRLSNLITQQAVIVTLIKNIVENASYKYTKEASMRTIGESADKFITNLRKMFNDEKSY